MLRIASTNHKRRHLSGIAVRRRAPGRKPMKEILSFGAGPDADRRPILLIPNGTRGSKSVPSNILGVRTGAQTAPIDVIQLQNLTRR